MKVLISILMALLPQTNAVAYEAGVRQIEVHSPEREVDLSVTIWYPASSGGEVVLLGDNVFFEGTPAMRDAPIIDGQLPLILLSHGAGLAGRAEAMSWIATPLAESGFVVIAPTHPGNTGPNRSAAETMKLWLRPSDLSATLDSIEADATLQAHIDFDRVGVLGMSMGGNTALSIAGARIDPDLLMSYCDTNDLNPSLCDWVRLSGVNLRDLDQTAAGRDNKDERVRFVMALDPVPVDVFSPETFSNISIPVALVNLGKEKEIPDTAKATETAEAIPGATYEVIENASHYSMFARCKPGAAEIAIEEQIEDPICTDGSAQSRSEVHTLLVDMVAAAFNRALKLNH